MYILTTESARPGNRTSSYLGAAALAILAVGLTDVADAVPFYVQAIASAQTSGNILNGQAFSKDTGQVQALSTSAGPFAAMSAGGLYGFNASSETVTELGAIHGHAVAIASSTGPAGGANATSQGLWSDTLTVTSNTLPAGTPVSFLATVTMHRTVSGNVAPGFQASAEVTGPLGLHILDSLSSPNATQSVSTVYNSTVGTVFSLSSTLTLTAGGGNIAPFSFTGSVLADNTAVFSFAPITPGASYSSASGVVFVPEPSTVVLAVSIFALPTTHRRRRG